MKDVERIRIINDNDKKRMDNRSSLMLGDIDVMLAEIRYLRARVEELEGKVKSAVAYADKCIANDPPICKLDIYLSFKQILGEP